MTSKLQVELELLNAATERKYTIRQEGDKFVVLMPSGMGEYPARDELATRQSLMRMTICANGRGAR